MSGDESGGVEGEHIDRTGRFQVVRWVLVAIVLVASVYLLAGGYRICEETANSAGGVVEVCRAPEATDPLFIVAVLAIAMLLWPDMSEIGIPGLLSLKRRVRQAENDVAVQARRSDSLESMLVVTQSQLAATATASASANNTFLLTSDGLRQVSEDIEDKAERHARSGADGPGSRSDRGPSGTEPHASTIERLEASGTRSERGAPIKLDLIEAWEELSGALFLSGANLREARKVLPEALLSSREDFVHFFRDEIDLVRAARNNVAHAKQLTDDDAAEAVSVARTLLKAWSDECERTGFRAT